MSLVGFSSWVLLDDLFRNDRTMKVFVSDIYPPVQERLVNMISALKGVEVVGRAEDPARGVEAIERLAPDVVVMSARPAMMPQLQKLRDFKTKNKNLVIIVLADQPSFSGTRLLNGGADFVFHRSGEFKKMVKLIEKMSAENKAVVRCNSASGKRRRHPCPARRKSKGEH